MPEVVGILSDDGLPGGNEFPFRVLTFLLSFRLAIMGAYLSSPACSDRIHGRIGARPPAACSRSFRPLSECYPPSHLRSCEGLCAMPPAGLFVCAPARIPTESELMQDEAVFRMYQHFFLLLFVANIPPSVEPTILPHPSFSQVFEFLPPLLCCKVFVESLVVFGAFLEVGVRFPFLLSRQYPNY